MDNLTHSLTGLALSRAGLNRFSPHATALLVLSANAPDCDVVAATRGSLAYLEAHRGYTHSLLGLPVIALLCVLVVAAIFRSKLPWGRAWLLCCLGVASHLLLDLTNSYGIRLLVPFSSRWSHLDLNGLYDAWILAVLAFAAVWPLFARLVSSEIGSRAPSGRGTALLALGFFVVFDFARAVLHAQAVAQLDSRLWNGNPALQTAAMPDSFSPFRWRGVVETAADYRLLDLNTRAPSDLGDLHHRYTKLPWGAELANAARTEPFRYFLYFARFPVWSESPVVVNGDARKRVDLTDLRFGAPNSGSFHCIALANARDRTVQSWFTFGSGQDLGWGQ